MEKVFDSEQYGHIVCTQNFFGELKSVSINGERLKKVSKKAYSSQNGLRADVWGNVLSGITLSINGNKFEILQKPTWYEATLSVMIFALILIWGNTPLSLIVPVVGGAIGGVISAFFALTSLSVCRYFEKPLIKVAISLGFMATTFLICAIIGFALVSLFT